MIRNRNLAVAFTLFALACVAVLGAKTQFATGLFLHNPYSTASQSSEIPDAALYDQLFELEIRLKEKARTPDANGDVKPEIGGYIPSQAGLNDQQSASFTMVAQNYVTEIAIIDAAIAYEIRKLRAAGVGKGLPIEQRPGPSAELARLQERKDKVALSYRDLLEIQLGESSFRDFDAYVKSSFASHLKHVRLTSEVLENSQGGVK